jgi:hypothetical protein
MNSSGVWVLPQASCLQPNAPLVLCVDSYSGFPYSPPSKATNSQHHVLRRIIAQSIRKGLSSFNNLKTKGRRNDE